MKSSKLCLLVGILLFSRVTFAQNSFYHSVFFNTAESEIISSEKEKLVSFIHKIDTTTEFEIYINSYCDDRGSIDFNLKLSEQRATVVKDLLLQQKINSKFIIGINPKGEVPLDSTKNRIDDQRKYNRRSDLILTYKPKIAEKTIVPATAEKELFADSMKVGDKFTLDNILFEGGRTLLLEESYPALNNLVLALKSKPQYEICILGHVCCTQFGMDGLDHDTGKRNLSEARAKTIYSYLISKGISSSRLSYKGMKGNFPTGLGDKYDRRVELEIVAIR